MEISCAICDDKFNTTCHIGATLCGHVFHYECFSKWEERSNTCPQCRLVVETNDMRRLYLNINQEKEYHLAENCVAEDFAKELDFVLEQNNLLKSEFKVGEENLEKLMCEKLSLRDEIETLKANVEETNIKYTNLKRNLKKYKKETTKVIENLQTLGKDLCNIQIQLRILESIEEVTDENDEVIESSSSET